MVIVSSVALPVSVKPRDVSSTKASISRECRWSESGEENFIRCFVRRSKVFISVTTRVSHTAGEAPLPWPVPKRGDCGVPLYVSWDIP